MQRRCWSATPVAGPLIDIPRASKPLVRWTVVRRPLTLAVALCAGAACGRGGSSADTTANVVPGANTVPTAGAPGDTAAPQGATWNLEMAEGQLREAGFAVNRDRTPVNVPFMSVPGTSLDLGGGISVQVYFYGDAAARGLDTDKLDPARAAPASGPVPWRSPAQLVTDNNMAAIVLTSDQSARTRIAEALHRRSEGDGALRDSVPTSPP